MVTALIVGGDSQIGGAVAARLTDRGWRVVVTSRRRHPADPDRLHLDLAACVDGVPMLPVCDVCLIAAAATGLEDCRRAPEATRCINVTGTSAVARAVADQGGFVLLLSTNQVFDGLRPRRAPADPVNPRSVYGVQKVEAESAIRVLGPNGAVLRLTKVLSPGLPLLARWAEALRANQKIEAFGDMHMAPVTLDATVTAIERVLERRATGTHHLSGDIDVSYADAARRLAESLGRPLDLVSSAHWRDAGFLPENAPLNTTLDSSGLIQLGLFPPTTAECLNGVFMALVGEQKERVRQ